MSEIRENISSTSRVLLKGMKSYQYDLGRPPEMWRIITRWNINMMS